MNNNKERGRPECCVTDESPRGVSEGDVSI
jgi:hypothetical protein